MKLYIISFVYYMIILQGVSKIGEVISKGLLIKVDQETIF